MTDADRALGPLEEARAAITRLETYEKPQELAEALEAIGQAVERSLRQLLRLDPSQPDDIRLNAQNPAEIPFDRALSLLRQQNRISLGLGNQVHELRQAVARSRTGSVHAADADQALGLLARLREEIAASPRVRAAHAANDRAVLAAAHGAVERGEFEETPHTVPSSGRRWPLRVALALAVFALGFAGYRLLGGSDPSELERGVEAFRAGQLATAERHFRAALAESENATTELYLGRVLRRSQKLNEAAAVLNAARKRYPEDGDVLRELGYLLAVDLGRPAAAVEPLKRAVELDPEEDANWIALVRALRAAGDSSAGHWLLRAPATAQAVLRSNTP